MPDDSPIDDDLKCLLEEDREIDRIQAKLDLAKEAVKEIKDELAAALDRRARLSKEIREGCPLFAGLEDHEREERPSVEFTATDGRTVTLAGGLRKAGR